MIRPALALAFSLALMLGAARPALAQSAAPQQNDAVESLLRARGEAYHRAPDSEQNPDEVRATQALNAEITAQNELAANQEAADRAAYEAAEAQHRSEVAAIQSRQTEEGDAYAEAMRAHEAAQARYELEMANWRATNEACARGHTARCRAGRAGYARY